MGKLWKAQEIEGQWFVLSETGEILAKVYGATIEEQKLNAEAMACK